MPADTPRVAGRPARVRWLGAAASLLLALALAEITARAFHRPFLALGEVEKWDEEAMAETHRPPPDRFGHREEELGDEAFAAGVTRLLFLGDSFTYGQGVLDGAARFTDRLEAALDASGRRVHVYNAGVNGSNPSDWTKTFAELLPAYRPDVVFGVFFLRCGTKLSTSFRFYQDYVATLRAEYATGWPYRLSYLYREWAERRVRARFSAAYAGRIVEAYLGDESQRKPWLAEQRALRELAARCAEAGVAFHLVLFPMLFELDADPFAAVEHEIERFAREAGIPLFSLGPAFHGRDARALWVSPSDQHPNEEGHRIAAEALLPFVESVLAGLQRRGG